MYSVVKNLETLLTQTLFGYNIYSKLSFISYSCIRHSYTQYFLLGFFFPHLTLYSYFYVLFGSAYMLRFSDIRMTHNMCIYA